MDNKMSSEWQILADNANASYIHAKKGNSFEFYEAIEDVLDCFLNLISIDDVFVDPISNILNSVSCITSIVEECRRGVIIPSMKQYLFELDDGEVFFCVANTDEFMEIVRKEDE